MTQSVSIADLMAQSGVAFGTSGARGLVSAMTDRVCFAYTAAFLQHLAAIGQFASGTHVAIAGDLRPSSLRIMAACAAAIRHMGGEVDHCGFIPSPAVAAYGFERSIPSLMVTGSHIPDDRNGIKFNRTDGEVLKPDELAIRAQDVVLPDLFDSEGMLKGAASAGPLIDAATPYIARYVDAFGSQALVGLTLGVYEHSAVGRDILVALVEALGGRAVSLGRSDRFIPVDTEAVRPEDQQLAQEWAADFKLDAILSTDGDSDRPLLADEHGVWIRGDVLGILSARALGIAAIATPVSCNSAVELSGLFTAVRRTRIGSPFVIEAMNALVAEGQGSVCGYEANGGFLLATPVEVDGRTLNALPTRDAVLPILSVLVDARRQGVTLSALQAQLPERYTFSERLQDYPTAQSQALIADLEQGEEPAILARLTSMLGALAGEADGIDRTDGLRIHFAGGDIIHLRPSGNAPELRCYTESGSVERAASLNAQALALVRDYSVPA
ncbi:MAG: phosphomannomutase [Sphingobium sp.]|jgi:phosphomannomutase|uniref:phosphomannomutase n=1 Tax=Sphingobium sp. TaxID=1912891 RepID=UPI000C381CC1|nr:phosphomannomutase [Sphingobium sp.]MBU0658302.1 phosphomannomutase [Alphaproteobacteria bacterium]MBA4755764.1 phosphomannomutase [Sphingobium sp.]MBS87337.1 phosphomannomutase [Sphingobium sp.]MBU0774001.1 phosphomannomutase [Alphaproteobacteria bacterium]MBU1259263.1 phosphomannomutase [Alphaproteobacteria bacterium]